MDENGAGKWWGQRNCSFQGLSPSQNFNHCQKEGITVFEAWTLKRGGWFSMNKFRSLDFLFIKISFLPWPDSSVGWSVIPTHQGYRSSPWPGHIEETSNECLNKWSNESLSLSFSLFLLSLSKSIEKISFLVKGRDFLGRHGSSPSSNRSVLSIK